MKISLIFFFLVFFSISSDGQESDTLINENLIVRISRVNYIKDYKGLLHSYGDDHISIQKKNGKLIMIPIQEITNVKIRNKKSVKKGAFLGGSIGFGAVTLLSISSYDSSTDMISLNFLIVLGGALVAIPGAIIGAIFGSKKTKIDVSGNIDKFRKGLNDFITINI